MKALEWPQHFFHYVSKSTGIVFQKLNGTLFHSLWSDFMVVLHVITCKLEDDFIKTSDRYRVAIAFTCVNLRGFFQTLVGS